MKTISKTAYDLLINSWYSDDDDLLGTVNKFTSYPYSISNVKDEVLRIKHLKEKRFLNKIEISTTNSIWRPYQGLLNYIASSLPNMGYEMGQCNTVYLKQTNFMGCWDNVDEYAPFLKCEDKHGECSLSISAKELKQIIIIGGLVTFIGEKIQRNFFKCKWVTSTGKKELFRLNIIDGYLFEDYHFIASSLKEAKDIVRARKAGIQIDKGSLKLKDILQKFKLNEIFVEYQDSLNAGNCAAGTENFANINSIDLSTIGAIRADYLVLISQQTDLGRRMSKSVYNTIDSAKLRYAQMVLSGTLNVLLNHTKYK